MAFNFSFTLDRDFISFINRFRFLTVLTLFFLEASSLLASQTYLLSYRSQIKNAVLISESFHLTKSMQGVYATAGQRLRLDALNETDIHVIFNKNRDEILEFFMKYGAHTRSHENVNNNKSSSLISITIPPTYITVDFKNDYAIITRLITQ